MVWVREGPRHGQPRLLKPGGHTGRGLGTGVGGWGGDRSLVPFHFDRKIEVPRTDTLQPT